MDNTCIVLDSNIYRNLARDSKFTAEHLDAYLNKFQRRNITPVIHPTVFMELASHLDASGPGYTATSYKDCLSGLNIQYCLCSFGELVIPQVISEPNFLLKSYLFGCSIKDEWPGKVANLSSHIYRGRHDEIKKDLTTIRRYREHQKAETINNLKKYLVDSLGDINSRNQLNKLNKTPYEIINAFANHLTREAALQSGMKDGDFSFEDANKATKKLCSVTLQLHKNMVYRFKDIVARGNSPKLEDRKNFNTISDCMICLGIGLPLIRDKKLHFITEDADILNAASDAGQKEFVHKLDEFNLMIC